MQQFYRVADASRFMCRYAGASPGPDSVRRSNNLISVGFTNVFNVFFDSASTPIE